MAHQRTPPARIRHLIVSRTFEARRPCVPRSGCPRRGASRQRRSRHRARGTTIVILGGVKLIHFGGLKLIHPGSSRAVYLLRACFTDVSALLYPASRAPRQHETAMDRNWSGEALGPQARCARIELEHVPGGVPPRDSLYSRTSGSQSLSSSPSSVRAVTDLSARSSLGSTNLPERFELDNRRLRRPADGCPASSKGSQAVAITRDDAVRHSTPSQIFAAFNEDSADRLRTFLTVREVAALLRVSTATVYELCARGKLRHVRVLNAIRVAPCDLLGPLDCR
jgi:excisionase family DNA binding protein